MNVNLQIDRLVLDKIDLTPAQRRQLQATVETELSRLFSTQGVPAQWQNGGTIAHLPAGKLEVAQNATPSAMGQHIAQQIYAGLAQ